MAKAKKDKPEGGLAAAYPDDMPLDDNGQPLQEGTISVEQAQKLGVFDVESARIKKLHDDTMSRKAAGELEVRWNADPRIRYSQCITLNPQCWVEIEQIEPVKDDNIDPKPVSVLPDYGSLLKYIREEHWDGQRAAYKWILRSQTQPQHAYGIINFKADPTWKRSGREDENMPRNPQWGGPPPQYPYPPQGQQMYYPQPMPMAQPVYAQPPQYAPPPQPQQYAPAAPQPAAPAQPPAQAQPQQQAPQVTVQPPPVYMMQPPAPAPAPAPQPPSDPSTVQTLIQQIERQSAREAAMAEELRQMRAQQQQGGPYPPQYGGQQPGYPPQPPQGPYGMPGFPPQSPYGQPGYPPPPYGPTYGPPGYQPPPPYAPPGYPPPPPYAPPPYADPFGYPQAFGERPPPQQPSNLGQPSGYPSVQPAPAPQAMAVPQGQSQQAPQSPAPQGSPQQANPIQSMREGISMLREVSQMGKALARELAPEGPKDPPPFGDPNNPLGMPGEDDEDSPIKVKDVGALRAAWTRPSKDAPWQPVDWLMTGMVNSDKIMEAGKGIMSELRGILQEKRQGAQEQLMMMQRAVELAERKALIESGQLVPRSPYGVGAPPGYGAPHYPQQQYAPPQPPQYAPPPQPPQYAQQQYAPPQQQQQQQPYVPMRQQAYTPMQPTPEPTPAPAQQEALAVVETPAAAPQQIEVREVLSEPAALSEQPVAAPSNGHNDSPMSEARRLAADLMHFGKVKQDAPQA